MLPRPIRLVLIITTCVRSGPPRGAIIGPACQYPSFRFSFPGSRVLSHCFVSSPGFWPAGDANLVTSLLQVRKRLSGELDLELLRAFSRAPSPVCQEFSSVLTCCVFLSISSPVWAYVWSSSLRELQLNVCFGCYTHSPEQTQLDSLSPSLSNNATSWPR